ncbi:MAG: hypothetical protein ONB06_12070 [candidate division KSB1 bacterium]|nr:hypothetical protein [candidate division KSB1 bacterium]
MPLKIKPIDKVKERYSTNAAAASTTWQENFLATEIASKLKDPKAFQKFQQVAAQIPQRWKGAIDKLTDEDIKAPVRAKGPGVYSAGVAAAINKYEKGMNETVYAAAREVTLTPRGLPMSPDNIKRWQDWITAVHNKAVARKGGTPTR